MTQNCTLIDLPAPRGVADDPSDPLTGWYGALSDRSDGTGLVYGGYTATGDALKACSNGKCTLVSWATGKPIIGPYPACVAVSDTEYQCAIRDDDAARFRKKGYPNVQVAVCPP